MPFDVFNFLLCYVLGLSQHPPTRDMINLKYQRVCKFWYHRLRDVWELYYSSLSPIPNHTVYKTIQESHFFIITDTSYIKSLYKRVGNFIREIPNVSISPSGLCFIGLSHKYKSGVICTLYNLPYLKWKEPDYPLHHNYLVRQKFKRLLKNNSWLILTSSCLSAGEVYPIAPNQRRDEDLWLGWEPTEVQLLSHFCNEIRNNDEKYVFLLDEISRLCKFIENELDDYLDDKENYLQMLLLTLQQKIPTVSISVCERGVEIIGTKGQKIQFGVPNTLLYRFWAQPLHNFYHLHRFLKQFNNYSSLTLSFWIWEIIYPNMKLKFVHRPLEFPIEEK